jgi:hypothetical protein
VHAFTLLSSSLKQNLKNKEGWIEFIYRKDLDQLAKKIANEDKEL